MSRHLILSLALAAACGATSATSGPAVRNVTLANGVRLEYTERGPKQGTPVLMLHGITDAMTSWDPVLPHLPDGVRVLALTQRGHGGSARPTSGYRPEDFADDAALFLEALGLEDAVVVGHSMGAFVATHLAIRHPDRVRGLMLLAGGASIRSDSTIQAFIRDAILPLTDPVDSAFAAEFQQSTVVGPLPPGLLDRFIAESRRVPAFVWREAFTGLAAADPTANLAQITAPTRIVWGDRDAYFGRDQQEILLRGIPGARLVTWEGVGHAIHWEEPARVALEIADFLATLR